MAEIRAFRGTKIQLKMTGGVDFLSPFKVHISAILGPRVASVDFEIALSKKQLPLVNLAFFFAANFKLFSFSISINLLILFTVRLPYLRAVAIAATVSSGLILFS